jgi:hypothetical protein
MRSRDNTSMGRLATTLVMVVLAGFAVGCSSIYSEGMFALCRQSAVSDVSTRDHAVRAAEQFIRANKLDTDRRCPAKVRKHDLRRDSALCPHYSASQAAAFEVVSLDEFGWKVYFRMLVPSQRGELRTLDVYPADPNTNRPSRVCLRDV